MPAIDYRRLRAEVSISHVLELLDYQPTVRQHDQLRGPCPIHDSHSTASRIFSVNLSKNLFRCFKCEAAGNQLDLWRMVCRLPLYEASIVLGEKLGIDLPRLGTEKPLDSPRLH